MPTVMSWPRLRAGHHENTASFQGLLKAPARLVLVRPALDVSLAEDKMVSQAGRVYHQAVPPRSAPWATRL